MANSTKITNEETFNTASTNNTTNKKQASFLKSSNGMKAVHANAVAGGGDSKLQRMLLERGGTDAQNTSLENSSTWWNAKDAYDAAVASGDFAGAQNAILTMDRAHKAQNAFYKSLGIGYNTNPGMYDNLSVRPESSLKSTSELADLYGITTDEQTILNKFMELVDKQFALKRREYAQAENDWYTNMATVSADNVAALRKTYDNAVASGASSGLVAASILGEQLGLTQETIQSATDLANKRFNLTDQEAEARAQAALDAFNDSQNIKSTLGQLASQIYASDVQKDVAWWDREAQLDANDATRLGSVFSSLSQWMSNKNTNAVNLEIAKLEDAFKRYNILNQNEQNDKDRQTQVDVANINKDSYVESAEINANATMASSKNYNGGSYNNNSNNTNGYENLYITPDEAIDTAYTNGVNCYKNKPSNWYAKAKAEASTILKVQGWTGTEEGYKTALYNILKTFEARASK